MVAYKGYPFIIQPYFNFYSKERDIQAIKDTMEQRMVSTNKWLARSGDAAASSAR